MGYQYAAFFSYKRDPESDHWHSKVKQKLEHWLRQELVEQPNKIFLDTSDIQTGDQWEAKLGAAIRHSKCVICIWSPEYFRSEFCVSEWQSFVKRESSFCPGRSLVVPASYHDGVHFPADANTYQISDFSRFASTMPAFWQTEAAVTFETTLKQFAQEIAEKASSCPIYRDDFPVVRGVRHPIMAPVAIPRPASI